MTKCSLCTIEFEGAPFTIINPSVRIEDVCGDCLNLYANQMFDELAERIEEHNDLGEITLCGEES